MSSVALARITGPVLAANTRRGTSHKSGEPKPWEITTVNVLVANENVTVVQLPRKDDYGVYEGLEGGKPAAGEIVDFLVEFSIYGSDVQARVLRDFPADSALSAAA